MSSFLPLPWVNRPVSIAVLGDFILDEYLEGSVQRISPEAPVPVHRVIRTIQRAGGAANSALNIESIGGHALLFGIIGADSAGRDLKQLLGQSTIETQFLLESEAYPTIKKTRIMANRQQIVRVDWEELRPIPEELCEKLLDSLREASFQALLISDYGKGALPNAFLREVFRVCTQRNIPVVVDPKGDDYSRYEGATLVTPNRNEAFRALGLEPNEQWLHADLARRVRDRYSLRNILLTLGPEGMFYLGEETELHVPAIAREVFDVSGAGDTVAAIMSLALAVGCPPAEAMEYANRAAGIVVGKWGTQPILQNELERELSANPSHRFESSVQKIKTKNDLIALRGGLKSQGKRVVFTNGCFDILHAGHVCYLERAKSRGEILVVAVNSDRSVRSLKGAERPILVHADRMRLIAALQSVDYVVGFDEDTPESLIRALLPDILVKGADWPTDKIVGGDIVKEGGGVVDNIELSPGVSTTQIIDRVKSGRGVELH